MVALVCLCVRDCVCVCTSNTAAWPGNNPHEVWGGSCALPRLGLDNDVDDDVDAAPDDPLAAQLLEEMMNELGGIGKSTAPTKPKRAEHKFQKKGAKIKGRIKNATAGVDTTAGGQGFKMGKRGGLMPASAQAMIRSSKDAEA